MSVMSGSEVLQHLARLAPKLKVIIFTGQTARPEQLPGVSGVVTKPLSQQRLLAAVGRALSTNNSPLLTLSGGDLIVTCRI